MENIGASLFKLIRLLESESAVIPIDLFLYVCNASQTRGVFNALENEEVIPNFFEKISNNDLSGEERQKILTELYKIAEGIELDKIQKEERGITQDQVTEIIKINTEIAPVTSIEMAESKKNFVNKLVQNWIEQKKLQHTITDQQKNEIINKLTKDQHASSEDILYSANKEFRRILNTNQKQNDISIIDTVGFEEEFSSYNDYIIRRKTKGLLFKTLSKDFLPEADIDFYAEAVRQEVSMNPGIDERTLNNRANMISKTALALTTPYENRQNIFINRAVGKTYLNQNDVVLLLKEEMNKLLNNSDLGVKISPIFTTLQQSASKSQAQKTNLSGLINIANDLFTSLTKDQEDKEMGYGMYMLVRGMSLAKRKKFTTPIPIIKDVKTKKHSSSEDIALLNLWLLLADQEELNSFKTLFFNQQKRSENSNQELSVVLNSFFHDEKSFTLYVNKIKNEESNPFQIFLAFLYGRKSSAEFSKDTGLEIFDGKYRISNIFNNKQGILSKTLVNQIKNSSLLIKINQLTQKLNAFSFLSPIISKINGFINKYNNVLRNFTQKNKPQNWIFVFLILFILFIPVFLKDPTNQMALNLFGPALETSGIKNDSDISKYIGVKKSVSQSLFPTNNAGQVVYTITISAKEYPLTNIRIEDKFSVFMKPPSVPAPISQGVLPKTSLAPGESMAFSYIVDLSAFKDAIVSNDLLLYADVESVGTESVNISAVVQIGNPPGCFVFNNAIISFNDGGTNFTNAWSETDKNSVLKAVSAIITNGKLSSLICGGGGSVSLYRSFAKVPHGGYTLGSNGFVFYTPGVSSSLYTLAHEAGHIIIHRNPSLYRKFLDSVNINGKESVPCSYTAPSSLSQYNYGSEAFAEMVALYILQKSGRQSFLCFGSNVSFSFQTKYPSLWNFAENNIFN